MIEETINVLEKEEEEVNYCEDCTWDDEVFLFCRMFRW